MLTFAQEINRLRLAAELVHVRLQQINSLSIFPFYLDSDYRIVLRCGPSMWRPPLLTTNDNTPDRPPQKHVIIDFPSSSRTASSWRHFTQDGSHLDSTNGSLRHLIYGPSNRDCLPRHDTPHVSTWHFAASTRSTHRIYGAFCISWLFSSSLHLHHCTNHWAFHAFGLGAGYLF